MLRDRRTRVAMVAGALIVLVAARQPSADIRILTHDRGDTTPARFQAAVDVGLMAVSILVTWTSRHLATPR